MNEFISELQAHVTSGNLWDAIVAVAPLVGALILFVFGLIVVGRFIRELVELRHMIKG